MFVIIYCAENGMNWGMMAHPIFSKRNRKFIISYTEAKIEQNGVSHFTSVQQNSSYCYQFHCARNRPKWTARFTLQPYPVKIQKFLPNYRFFISSTFHQRRIHFSGSSSEITGGRALIHLFTSASPTARGHFLGLKAHFQRPSWAKIFKSSHGWTYHNYATYRGSASDAITSGPIPPPPPSRPLSERDFRPGELARYLSRSRSLRGRKNSASLSEPGLGEEEGRTSRRTFARGPAV